jgi:HSP20 family molecular chaperone IbpA
MPHNGKVCRSVPFPDSVDVDKVTATLDDGMLVIKAAKAVAPKSRQIAVSASA